MPVRTVLAPAEKLPLAVRKNVRDEWESKRPELEKDLSTLLKVDWKIDINPAAIWVYAEHGSYGKDNLGGCIHSYVSDTIHYLKSFLEEHGELGRDEINGLCSEHKITMEMDAEGKVSYCGVGIYDGTLRILFGPDNLGVNISHVLSNLEDALSSAPLDSPLSSSARHSIALDYDGKIDETRDRIVKQLANPSIKLDPNWSVVFAALKADPKVKENREDWEKSLGSMMVYYFKALADSLEYRNFGDDELLREGFEESVSKGEIKFRFVKDLGSEYNGLAVEDGILYLQTETRNWATNTHNIADKIVEVL